MNKKILVFLIASFLSLRVALAQEAKKAFFLDGFQGEVAQGQTIPIQASEAIPWDSYGAISFWLQTSGAAAQVVLEIEDAEGEIHRYAVKSDTPGRRQIICSFSQFFPRAYGQPIMVEPNGEIDFPIKSLRFEPVGAAAGPVIVDEVSLEPLN